MQNYGTSHKLTSYHISCWVESIVGLDFLPGFEQTVCQRVGKLLDEFSGKEKNQARHTVKIFKSLAKAAAYDGQYANLWAVFLSKIVPLVLKMPFDSKTHGGLIFTEALLKADQQIDRNLVPDGLQKKISSQMRGKNVKSYNIVN